MQKRKTAIGIILIAIMLSTFLLIQPAAAQGSGYRDISVQQARRMIKHNSGNTVILDVRNQSEYDLGHLYGAILIPIYSIENSSIPISLPQPPINDSLTTDIYERIENGFKLSEHKNDNIIVYCAVGSRSALACQILVEHGFTKIYNMLGGITAWMQAEYPIYTSYHHVSVDVVDKKTIVQVEPWLLYQLSCTSCQNQYQPCSVSNIQANTTETVIEESKDHIVLLIKEEINGSTCEYTVGKTLLWHHNETANDFNKTITFISTIITAEGKSTHIFGLYDYVQHEDYNLTVGTLLYPLDLETYNRSITTVEYIPTGAKEVVTIEQVDFKTSVTLFELYKSLGKVIDKLGKTYEKSEDAKLKVFAERYYTIADEIKLLSKLVKTQISEYNRNILNNTAVIQDGFWCDWCPIWCPGLLLVGCGIACLLSWSTGCYFCGAYGTYLLQGCDAVCAFVCVYEMSQQPSRWLSSITYTGGYGGYAVGNPSNLLGPYSDNQFAHLHASNYGDCAQIFGMLNEATTGDIYIQGCSGPGGYYSDLYVYVSYDNQNWYWVNTLRITSTSSYSIHVGHVSNSFRYIAINGYDSGFSVCLYLDAVSVVP